MATNLTVPSGSNVGGVNQSSGLPRPTAPVQRAGGGSLPVGQMPFSGGQPPTTGPISIGGAGTGTLPAAGSLYPTDPSGRSITAGAPAVPGSLYNPASSYSGGQSNIAKQLVDIYGKGTGGMLDYLLQNMQGADSAMFQQYLQSMKPAYAQEEAQLGAQLGGAGISANSSVNAIAQSNLAAQQNAQASAFDAQLMQQQLQDTIGIVQSTMPSAQKETATSGWTIFGDVMQQLTGDVGALFGGPGPNPASMGMAGGGGSSGGFGGFLNSLGIGGSSGNYNTPNPGNELGSVGALASTDPMAALIGG